MQPVQGIITWRRILYYALLLTSLGFLFSPLPIALDCMKADQCTTENGLLDPLLAMTMKMLPDVTAPWVKVLRDSPKILYSLILLFTMFSVMKAKAWTKTQQLATTGWAAMKNKERQ